MVTVFGLGFVGLTTALGFADLGIKTYGIDIDGERLSRINHGKLPFYEPGMKEALVRCLEKSFIPTTDIEAAVINSNYIFYCVGTPYGEGGQADLRYLFSAIDSTLNSISDEKKRVLIIKSTVPPGTVGVKVKEYLLNHENYRSEIYLANNPEFLREGHCWGDFTNPDRIVVGYSDEIVKKMMEELYSKFEAPIHFVSHNTAEFIKYLSNTMLATMISFSNEMAEIADAIGDIEVGDSFRILHEDRRWNGANMASYVYPGCGYGGYCLPKDTNAMLACAKSFGYNAKLLEQTINVNDERPLYVARKITEAAGDKDKVIGVLGLSFKPGSDDVRDAAAAKIIKNMNVMGYSNIVAYDPVATEEFNRHYPNLAVAFCDSKESVINQSDVIAIVTAWDDFKSLRDCLIKPIIDCRYMF